MTEKRKWSKSRDEKMEKSRDWMERYQQKSTGGDFLKEVFVIKISRTFL